MRKTLAVMVGLAAVAAAISAQPLHGQVLLMNFQRQALVRAWDDHLTGAASCGLSVEILGGSDWLLGAAYGVHYVRFPAVVTCS